jgi:tRNA U34 5-carboxymethylaminomethyl modifying GTPase MnmE/TrmE
LVLLEAELDFSDQEIEFTPTEALLPSLQEIKETTLSLLDTY